MDNKDVEGISEDNFFLWKFKKWTLRGKRFLIPGEIPFLLEVQEMVAEKRRQVLF